MASAENSVQITVSFSGQEQVLPLSVRPSLELNDHKVNAAEEQLDEALRRAFSLNSNAKLYLHETMTGQVMSKESFRDPGYCSNFPRYWYLVVERENFANINGKAVGEFVNDSRVFDEGGGREASEVEEVTKMFDLGEVGFARGVEADDYQDPTGVKVSLCVFGVVWCGVARRGGGGVCVYVFVCFVCVSLLRSTLSDLSYCNNTNVLIG